MTTPPTHPPEGMPELPADVKAMIERFRRSHAWLVEGIPVSHGAAATDFKLAADTIEALHAATKAPPMPEEVAELIKRLEALHDQCKDHEAAGFPIEDPHDIYPHDLWGAHTSPDRLKPFLDWLRAQGITAKE